MYFRGVSGASGDDKDAGSRTRLTENGGNEGNNVGSFQGDAIRNIKGVATGAPCEHYKGDPTGPFYRTGQGTVEGHKYTVSSLGFDASLTVPTGSDNRPQNVYVTYIIKY
jgi:hypothetical protein